MLSPFLGSIMVIGSAHIAFVLAAIIERTQGLVQHNNVDQVRLLVLRAEYLMVLFVGKGPAVNMVLSLSFCFQFPFGAIVHW